MVSVIIPVYNGERFISDAIESVINQIYRDFEIIIIDDGSTDNSRLIINEYLKIYSNMRYIYQSNQGPSKARNNGFIHSSGEYIAFLDADDIFEPNRLEEAVKVLDQNNSIDVVYNPVYLINSNNDILKLLEAEVTFGHREDMLAYTLFRQTIPCPPSLLLRRKCLEAVKYPEDMIYAEDYLFTIKLLEQFNFYYLDFVLYRYRRHEENLTNKHNLQKNNEIEVIKNIGKENLIKVVNKSNYTIEEKNFLIAKILYKIENYNDSIHYLNLLNDNNMLKNFYLGNCYYKLDYMNKAKFYYEQSILLDNSLSEVYNNLGCCYLKINENNKAIICFQKALKYRKDYLDAQKNLKALDGKGPWFTERELRKILMDYNN